MQELPVVFSACNPNSNPAGHVMRDSGIGRHRALVPYIPGLCLLRGGRAWGWWRSSSRFRIAAVLLGLYLGDYVLELLAGFSHHFACPVSDRITRSNSVFEQRPQAASEQFRREHGPDSDQNPGDQIDFDQGSGESDRCNRAGLRCEARLLRWAG